MRQSYQVSLTGEEISLTRREDAIDKHMFCEHEIRPDLIVAVEPPGWADSRGFWDTLKKNRQGIGSWLWTNIPFHHHRVDNNGMQAKESR